MKPTINAQQKKKILILQANSLYLDQKAVKCTIYKRLCGKFSSS